MKAVRLTSIGKPLQEQDIPIPVVGDNDVRVRIRAAGICHSDAHYRSGISDLGPLPLTLGHEIAGEVEQVGKYVTSVAAGQRVCLHYLLACGSCEQCSKGHEQYCIHGGMLGHHVDGGYATHIVVPERNAIPLPDDIPFEHGAIMMCSSATALHALHKARFSAGESVAVFGAGGLGMSAIQIAHALGALEVFAVDIDAEKLRMAESLGAVAIDASQHDPVQEIQRLTKRKGVHVSLEFVGLPRTTQQSVRCLGLFGRCVVVGISSSPVELHTYTELIGRETEIIGANDHLLPEIHLLLELAKHGKLDVSAIVSRTVPLEADSINDVLTQLESFSSGVRTVVVQ